MLINHPKMDVQKPLMLNNTEIKQPKKTKSLGVIVDERFELGAACQSC